MDSTREIAEHARATEENQMHILSTAKIREFAEAVLRVENDAFTGELDPDKIKVLLGEMLDVWPASIFPGLDELQKNQDT